MDEPKAPGCDQTQTRLDESESRASSVEKRTARYFGDYELLEEIARGGMGVVYRARHLKLERIVALKLILAGQFAGRQIIQRFRGEVTAAALLQHPNIVAIHDVGIHDDQHYFSMDYVKGQNLSQLVGNRPLPPAKAARYVQLIAEAIHYAHGQGILHRDLKPSNVLIDAATDQPRITDFGLAKRMEGESSLTVTGQVLGSPNFMPPEQAGSEHGKVGRHSDVYGLGAILYYLLTARPPFQADSLEGIVTQVLQNEPVAPRTLNPSVPRDLETICLKCLTKEPHKRYATAGEMAEELGRFLKDEPIRARPATQAEKAWRWCRRNPAIASLSAATVLLLLAVAVGSPIAAFRINRARQQALEDHQRAEASLYASEMHEAESALEDGDLGHARDLVEAHRPRPDQPDLRGFEWRLLWQRCLGDDLFALNGHSNFVKAVRFSPDGKTLATWSADNHLKVWDLVQRTERFTITNVTGLGGFTAEGQRFVYGTQDGSVKLCEAGTGRTIRSLEKMGELVALLADGTTVATTAAEFIVKFWNLDSGQEMFALPGKGGIDLRGPEFGAAVVVTPDGKRLAIADRTTKVISLWDLITSQVLNSSLDEHRNPLTFLEVSADGKILATGAFDGLVRFWDMASGAELLPPIQAHAEPVISAAFSSDGQLLATASLDQTIKLWDFARRQLLDTLKGHDSGVMAISFSTDGRRLASGGQDKTVRIWSTGQKHIKQVLPGVDFGSGVIWSRDSRLLATGCEDGTVKLWDAATLETRVIIPGASRPLTFSDDGKAILIRFEDRIVSFCEITTGNVIREAPAPPPGDWYRAVVSPDGRVASITDSTPIIRLWDMVAGSADSLTGHNRDFFAVAFSRDGQTLIGGGSEGVLDIWNVGERRCLASIPAHAARIFSVAISPDGELAATGSTDCTIKLWNLRTRECVATLKGHRRPIWALAFSPDGKTLASGGGDRTVRLWSVSLRRELAVLREFTSGKQTALPGEIRSLAFSPDGNNLAATTQGGNLILFRAATLVEAESRAGVAHLLPKQAP